SGGGGGMCGDESAAPSIARATRIAPPLPQAEEEKGPVTFSALEVDELTKLYPNTAGRTGGVQSASFTIPEGELFTLLGPSGCGKTTTLRAIAGLETPDKGRITIAGREMFNGSTGINVALNL